MPIERQLSARDIEIAYELMLGRAPENATVVSEHLQEARTLGELRARFLRSNEFRRYIETLGPQLQLGKPLDCPAVEVEVDVPRETLAAMLRHIEKNWELLGRREPHWSVLTHEDYKPSNIAAHKADFYETGKQAVGFFTAAADRAKANFKECNRCFELGCGVGRLSVWLAGLFPNLVAGDISAPHLALAQQAVADAGLNNVEFRLLDRVSKLDELLEFDCFFSLIVLQHNPPPVIAFLLRTILNKLNPGGLAYFQVPTYRWAAPFDAREYLAKALVDGTMEVHAIPQATLWRIAGEANCELLDIREDNWVGGADVVSNSILLRKKA